MIIQFAISRQNEFQADATAARITGKPQDLAGALRRLDAYAQRIPMQVNPAAAQLAIVNPLRGAGAMRLFSTHPATEDRVARLRQLARRPAVPRSPEPASAGQSFSEHAAGAYAGRTLII
jgi:heat shock protein HtpX